MLHEFSSATKLSQPTHLQKALRKMSQATYKTLPYNPKLFNHLKHLEDAHRELEHRNVSRDNLSSVR